MNKNLTYAIGTVVEVVGIIALTGFALWTECRRHKTKLELCDANIELAFTKLDGYVKDFKIRDLEEELAKFKNGEES